MLLIADEMERMTPATCFGSNTFIFEEIDQLQLLSAEKVKKGKFEKVSISTLSKVLRNIFSLVTFNQNLPPSALPLDSYTFSS